jgi:hypothetical protein
VGGGMSQSETDKIKAAIGDYRQFKFKFVQFVKNFEEFLSEAKLLEIKLKKSSDTTLQLSVFDSPVLVKFSLMLTTEDTLLGKVEFEKLDEFDGSKHEQIYSLFFNKLGNILESLSDSFSSRSMIDKHDVPYVLHRFLQNFLQKLKIKES